MTDITSVSPGGLHDAHAVTGKNIADIHPQRRAKSWESLTLHLQLSSSPTKARCVFQNSRRALSPAKRRNIGCWIFNRGAIVTPSPGPPVCMHLRPPLRPLVFLLRFDSGTCCPPPPPPAPSPPPPPPPQAPAAAASIDASKRRLGGWGHGPRTSTAGADTSVKSSCRLTSVDLF